MPKKSRSALQPELIVINAHCSATRRPVFTAHLTGWVKTPPVETCEKARCRAQWECVRMCLCVSEGVCVCVCVCAALDCNIAPPPFPPGLLLTAKPLEKKEGKIANPLSNNGADESTHRSVTTGPHGRGGEAHATPPPLILGVLPRSWPHRAW